MKSPRRPTASDEAGYQILINEGLGLGADVALESSEDATSSMDCSVTSPCHRPCPHSESSGVEAPSDILPTEVQYLGLRFRYRLLSPESDQSGRGEAAGGLSALAEGNMLSSVCREVSAEECSHFSMIACSSHSKYPSLPSPR